MSKAGPADQADPDADPDGSDEVGGARPWRDRGPRQWLRPATEAGRSFLDRPYASTQLMLLTGLCLLLVGVMMAASTTISASLQQGSHQDIWSQLVKEIEFLVIGVPVFWLAVRMPPSAYRRLAYPMLGIGLFALMAVLVPGIGAVVNGAHRWIMFGPLGVQPSEFVKIAILLWGGDLLTRKLHFGTLTSARHLFVPLVPMFVLVCALVMIEPDLGTTLCFLLILLGLLWTVGTPFRYFAVIVAAIGAAVGALAYFEPYRLARLTSFTDPFKSSQHGGYQAVQGLYALASGGIFGVGLGNGTAKYNWLPNANTDYVFAVVGEELGLIGCVVVLALFGLFAFTGMRISRRADDPFIRLVGGGATIWITGQAVINVGYVTGLLPVTGIPLPFISDGGTSLLATCLVFGMMVSFARHDPAAVKAAQLSAQLGQRGRIERWARIAVPKTYVERKRPARPPATRPAARPARAGASGTRAATQAATQAAKAAASQRQVPRPPQRQPARPPQVARASATGTSGSGPRLRPTGTESPRRRSTR